MPSQTFRELGAALKRGAFEPVYYFHGPEDVLKEDALRFLLDRTLDPALRDFNLDQRSAGQLDPESIEALCSTLPMMAERRVVVIRDVEQWKRKTKSRAAFLTYLTRPSPETIVVLIQSAAEDGEDKELARLAMSVCFAQPTVSEAEKWLARQAAALGIVFAPNAAEHLLRCTGPDLSAIRLELDKLAALPAGSAITAEQVGELVGIRRGETIFDWRDAVVGGEPGKAVGLLGRVLDQPGVSGVKLVTLLGTTLIGLGVTRAAYDRGARGAALERLAFEALRAARPFGLGNWKDETARWARWAAAWPAPRLRDALVATLATDRALKSTTLTDERGLVADLTMTIALARQAAA